MNGSEIGVIVALGTGIVVTLLPLRRVLFAVVTDEEWARVAGLPVGFLNTLFAILVAVSVVAAMRIVGILLVAALMVMPVASGQLLARSFAGTIRWSVAIGVGSAIAGLAAARIWGLAPSAMIVLITAAVYGVTGDGEHVFAAVGGEILAYPLTCEAACAPVWRAEVPGETWWLFVDGHRLVAVSRMGGVMALGITITVFEASSEEPPR